MLQGRLLETNFGDPYSNIAFEETLLRASEHPTLRIWENQKSVIIGRAQRAEYETDLDYCEKHSIPVVRRITAGGTVYNGPGNLNWSYIVPTNRWLANILGAKQAFELFAGLVKGALEKCGVQSEFVPPHTLTNGRGKISGMAAYLSRGSVLCHGTLLIDADLEEVQRLTEPKKEELPRRYPRSRFTEVANCRVQKSSFVKELAGSGGGFEPGEPTSDEEDVLGRLLETYRSPKWNLGDPFS